MKALLLSEYRKLELVDFPEPELAADEVLVRVAACGICGSDVHGYDGSSGRRIPPLVMGHEAAGAIEQVGRGVTAYAVGDRVTFDSTIYCGHCSFCSAGQINLCDDRQVLGVSCGDYRRHGAFAELVAVPQRVLYKVPDSLPLAHAAMVEPVSVAVHAVALGSDKQGKTAVVVGAGMIGLLVVQALRAAGAAEVIAVDLSDEKLALAKQLGASHGVNPNSEDAVAKVLDLTSGRSADLAYEVVGATPTVQTAIACVKKGGQVTLVGNLSPTVEAPLQAIVTRELTLYGSCASQGEYPRCIELMAAGKIDVAPLITALAPLMEGPDWFGRLYDKEPGSMKVLLEP